MLDFKLLFAGFSLFFIMKQVLGSTHNLSCHEIKTSNGYKIPLNCSREISVSLENNGTVIANYENEMQSEMLPNVGAINNKYIILKKCFSIRVNCYNEVSNKLEDTVFLVSEKTGEEGTSRSTAVQQVIGSTYNLSCHEITTSNGYKFPLNCSGEIFVSFENGTSIPNYENETQFKKSFIVEAINNKSIILKECLSIRVNCYNKVSNKLEVTVFLVSEKTGEEGSSRSTAVLIAFVVIIIGLPILCCFLCWKKKLKSQNKRLTFGGFWKYLKSGSCFRRSSLPENGNNIELGHISGNGVQEVTADREETAVKGEIMNHRADDSEEHNKLDSVQAHRSQNKRLTFGGFWKYLKSGSCFRRSSLPENGNNIELGHISGNGVQEVTAVTAVKGEIMNHRADDSEEHNRLDSVEAHSIDSQSDGNTARPLCLESSLSSKRRLPTENDDLFPSINGSCSHPHTQRKAWDDDRESSTNRKETLRNLDSKQECNDEEDQQAEEQSLLLDQRSVISSGAELMPNLHSDRDRPK